MTIRHLSLPLMLAALAVSTAPALAQGAFPAPLPNQSASPFPPVNGAPAATIGAPSGGFPSAGAPPVSGGGAFGAPPGPPQQQAGDDDCMKKFLPLREETEKRGKAIKAAGERRAPPDEACKLIGNFSQAELKMLKFIESNSARCGIPAEIGTQLRAGHKNTEQMQQKVCAMAQQQQQRGGPSGPSFSDLLGSSAAMPEANTTKRSGGSTFDTLNGNVLAR